MSPENPGRFSEPCCRATHQFRFSKLGCWYTKPDARQTRTTRLFAIRIARPDLPARPAPTRLYRNPVLFARELAVELERDHLTRQQLADRHGISLDRVIQWLCLLKMPAERLEEIAALGDNWDRRLVTERGLRQIRRSAGSRVDIHIE